MVTLKENSNHMLDDETSEEMNGIKNDDIFEEMD